MTTTKAIICDIDGTIANISHRVELIPTEVDKKQRDWKPFNEAGQHDVPYDHVVTLLRVFEEIGWVIILSTGRQELYKRETQDWLHKHNVPYHELFMRPKGDLRSDTEIKKDHYATLISMQDLDIQFVLEDRDKMVKMWREEIGLPCFQVKPGDY
jgi:hypothetical protein